MGADWNGHTKEAKNNSQSSPLFRFRQNFCAGIAQLGQLLMFRTSLDRFDG